MRTWKPCRNADLMSVIFSFGRRYGEVVCYKALDRLGSPNMPVNAVPALVRNDLRLFEGMGCSPPQRLHYQVSFPTNCMVRHPLA